MKDRRFRVSVFVSEDNLVEVVSLLKGHAVFIVTRPDEPDEAPEPAEPDKPKPSRHPTSETALGKLIMVRSYRSTSFKVTDKNLVAEVEKAGFKPASIGPAISRLVAEGALRRIGPSLYGVNG